MSVQAYINFNGNCREAVTFYAEAFGAEKPKIMTFGDMPVNQMFPVDEKIKDLVMHAELKITGSTVMFSDVPPDIPFFAGNHISLIITSKDMDEIKSMFHKIKDGGTVVMDLQETLWSKCYGFVIDRFGIGWQLSYEEQKH